MVTIEYDPSFERAVEKIRDAGLKERVKKHIIKIIEHPEIGKPMRFSRKGTREVYVSPYRLSYMFFENDQKIVFLDLYHKDEQ
ncbi:type II toxin-antitoxin system RelE/ParE family toxin [Candidatus Woesearchaeota archaeon]|nr:type II toxin-antitoxin system RelE/ParE family toxin [Candidatus Woesearchaeota archaeon]